MMRRGLLICVAGILLGAGPAAVDAALVRLKAGAAEGDVVAALREARALAVTRDAPVRVWVDEGMRALWVEGGHWRRLPDGVSLAGPPAGLDGQGVIVFRPDGSSSGGQIVVSWRGRAVSVLVDGPSGGVRRVWAGTVRAPGAAVRPGNAG
ncbi:MAG: GspH/FimT family pseudopilin [Bacteroidales bacterium]